MLAREVAVQPGERDPLPMIARAGALQALLEPAEMEFGVEREVDAARGHDVGADPVGDRDHLAGREQVGQGCEAPGRARLDPAAPVLGHDLVEALPVGRGQHQVQLVEQARDAGLEAVDRGLDVDRRRQVAKEPLGAPREREARLAQERVQLPGADLTGHKLQLAQQRHQREGVAGDDVGAPDRGDRAPGLAPRAR